MSHHPTRSHAVLRAATAAGVALASFGCFGPGSATVKIAGEFGTLVGTISVASEGGGKFDPANAIVRVTGSFESKEVQAAADGTFRLQVKAGSQYTVEAAQPDGKGELLKSARTVNVPVPTTADPPAINVESLVMRRTGAIQGVIELVSAKTGDEPAGADVYLAGGTNVVGKAGTRGQFTLAGVSEGTWNVVVEKPGYKRVTTKVEVKSGKPSLVGTVKLERQLEPAAGLKGRLVDQTGAPVIGAAVSVYPKDRAAIAGAAGGLDNFGAIADAKGNFELLNLPPSSYSVQIYRPFYETPPRVDITVSDKQTFDMQTITLKANEINFGQISGRVLDDKGQPVEGALVQTDPPVTDQQFADANGKFTLDRVRPGEYTVNASAGGLGVVAQYVYLSNTQGGTKLPLPDLVIGAGTSAQ